MTSGRGVEISADWARNVLLLPGRLSEARSARSRQATIPAIGRARPASISHQGLGSKIPARITDAILGWRPRPERDRLRQTDTTVGSKGQKGGTHAGADAGNNHGRRA